MKKDIDIKMAVFFRKTLFFYSKFLNLPIKLIKFFEHLASKDFVKIKKRKSIKVLNVFMNSTVFEETENSQFDFPYVIIKLDENEELSSFNDFTDEILTYKEDFKYFINVLLYLSNENNKYIHTRKPNKLFNILQQNIICKKNNEDSTKKESHVIDKQEDKSTSSTSANFRINDEPNRGNLHNNSDIMLCYYIQELCRFCIEKTLKRSIDIDMNRNKKIKNVIDDIMVIKNTLFTLTNIFENHSLRKITLYLDSIIPFSWEDIMSTELYYINYTRFLHLVINALNECRLDFCKPLEYEYILLNKKEYELRNLNSDTFTNLGHSIIKSNLIPYVKFDFQKLENLIDGYKDIYSYKYSKLYLSIFKYKLMFSWNGETKSFETINSSIYFTLCNPTILLAFFDILYKLSIAEFVFHTAVSLQGKNNFSEISDIIKDAQLKYIFPETFNGFINEYNEQLKQFLDKTDTTNQEIEISKKNLLKELIAILNVFGIYTNISEISFNLQHSVDYMQTKNILTDFIDKHANNVYKDFKDMYLFLSDEK